MASSPVDTRRWRRLLRRPAGMRAVWREVAEVRRRLRAGRFDVAIDLQGLIKSGALTAATRAPLRIGFAATHCRERLSARFTNRRVTPPPSAAHVVDQYLSLLSPLGIAPGTAAVSRARPARGGPPHGGAPRRARRQALRPPGRDQPRRGAGGQALAHRPSHRRVAERLATEAGARILLLWGPDEAHLAREIRDGLSARALLAPPTDLDELAGLLRRAALVIANDTGPLHLAAALGTPCLGLYGPTRSSRNGPYGVRCRALQSPDGTMAGLDAGRGVPDGARDARRGWGRPRDPPHRHHHRVERGGAAARLPRERGLGGRDRGDRRRVHRQDRRRSPGSSRIACG